MRRLPHLINNRNHGQQIHKRLSTLPIIDKRDLRLRLRRNAVLEVQHGIVIAVLALDARRDFTVGRLQEAAVLPDDFVARVACQALEGFGSVLDGGVVDFGVADDEGAGKVHGADVDLRVGTVGHFDLCKRSLVCGPSK